MVSPVFVSRDGLQRKVQALDPGLSVGIGKEQGRLVLLVLLGPDAEEPENLPDIYDGYKVKFRRMGIPHVTHRHKTDRKSVVKQKAARLHAK